jgi:hypothetical protein
VINNVCDNALLYGYAAGSARITREIIEEVIRALDLAPADSNDNTASSFGSEASSSL